MRRNVLLLALLLSGFSACTRSDEAAKSVELKIHALYAAQDYIYGQEVDTALFSADVVQRIQEVRQTTAEDRERISKSEYPTDKPLLLEGAVFSSLYDGFTSYSIAEVEVGEKTARVVVDFEYGSTPPERWKDTVLLVMEDGWKVDNVRFDPKYGGAKDLKSKLKLP
jgi:hypothetical protein